MYNGIGLQTPRGSGTNGRTQTNKFSLKPKSNTPSTNNPFGCTKSGAVACKPNKDILDHELKRRTELKLAVLEDKLIDQGYTAAEIAKILNEARRTLETPPLQ